MNQSELKEATDSLAKKRANQPCPRCSSNDFSIVGESEISVARAHIRPSNALAGLGSLPFIKTTMPVIIITCDNCGYVVQHAKAALVTIKNKLAVAGGLRGFANVSGADNG
jgi:predicted nucleic-acid-binding Zn-ribbon protein